MLWVYMESIVRFSTIENPMNCKVFKVNLIEKLIEKLKLANSTIFELCSVIRIWTFIRFHTFLDTKWMISLVSVDGFR